MAPEQDANDNPIPVYDPTAIDWDEIERLRRMSGSEKVMIGLRLQEMARMVTLAGIRHQNPGADEEEIHRLFMERISKRR